jgi:TIR domain/IPT/TIG domain
MQGNVFVSYRRDDTAGYAGRLYDRLKASFPGRVFIDVGEIPPGADFVKAIGQHLEGCAALVALIGDNWTAHDRLRDPADFVRLEISTALKRDISVVPVLVRAAKLPAAAALPEDIQALLRHQAISISDEDWDHGCERLIQALRAVLGPGRKRLNAAARWGLALAVTAIVVLALFLVYKSRNAAGPGSTPTQITQAPGPETTRAAADYDKSVAKSYENAADVMNKVAGQIGGAGQALGPAIASISPPTAPPGASVTINGTNFGASQGTSTVKFGSTAAAVKSWTATSINVQVPHIAAGPSTVVASVAGADSAPANFTVIGTQVQQTSSGAGSPNVQGVQGDVTITVDQSTGKTRTEKKKPAENKPKQENQ